MDKSYLFHLAKPWLFSYWSVPFFSSQFSFQFSCVNWKLSPVVCWEGSKAVRVLRWAMRCRLVVHGGWFFMLWAWQYGHRNVWIDLSQSSARIVRCALLVWGILGACLLLFGLKQVSLHRLSCARACLCCGVPHCVGLDKNLLFHLSVSLGNSAFWVAEGIDSSLSFWFCICKIASLLNSLQTVA